MPNMPGVLYLPPHKETAPTEGTGAAMGPSREAGAQGRQVCPLPGLPTPSTLRVLAGRALPQPGLASSAKSVC